MSHVINCLPKIDAIHPAWKNKQPRLRFIIQVILGRFASAPSAAGALAWPVVLGGTSTRGERGTPAAPAPSPGSGRFIDGGLYEFLLASGLPGPPGAPMRRA